MSIELSCPQCGAKHHINDRFAGRSVRCPSCESIVEVPEKAPEPELPPAAVAEDVGGAVSVDPVTVNPVTADPFETTFEDGSPIDSVSAADESAANQVVPSADEDPTVAVASPPAAAADDDDEDEEPVLGRGDRPEEEMDMTPMVDVTFLLLIFFMVTAAFSLQKSINMPRQQTDAPSTSVIEEESEDLDMVELEVDEFGAFLVMAPDWERETPGKQNLISALREALAGNKDGMRLAIKVHELAKLSALVDAMDAGTIAGFAQLEVTQVEDFD